MLLEVLKGCLRVSLSVFAVFLNQTAQLCFPKRHSYGSCDIVLPCNNANPQGWLFCCLVYGASGMTLILPNEALRLNRWRCAGQARAFFVFCQLTVSVRGYIESMGNPVRASPFIVFSRGRSLVQREGHAKIH